MRQVHGEGQSCSVLIITTVRLFWDLAIFGALASKPVMEGKAVLFKRFADIDVFDLELDTHNSDEVIKGLSTLEPTFGRDQSRRHQGAGMFCSIEETLKKTMNNPSLPTTTSTAQQSSPAQRC